MSQISGFIREKLNLTVHKIIFQKPVGEDKFVEVCQRYVNPKVDEFNLDKDHCYPFDPSKWVRQSKNRFIHYMDYEALQGFNFYSAWAVAKPDGIIMKAKEFAACRAAAVAKAVVQGGQLQAGVVLVILCVVVGLLGGILVGYFGLPAGLGQHLVQNGAVVIK